MESSKLGVEIGPGFWNYRCSFKIILGLVDLGSHMSIIRLSSGKFLLIDAIPLNDKLKAEIDGLTNNGSNIEAVVATHPFHTLSFPTFYKAYPNVPFYGTPRHLRKIPEIKWSGDLNDCKVRNKWQPEVFMQIPDGAEFAVPMPEARNHFSSVFVFHPESRSIHVDDTIMYSVNPGFLLKLGGFRAGSMCFHTTLKGVGLLPTPEAPFQFRDFIAKILKEWDFDNICTAHFGNKVGGAKQQLADVLKDAEPVFQYISDRNKKKTPTESSSSEESLNVNGNECG